MNRLFIIFSFILGCLICLPTIAATPSATLQVIEIKQNKNQTTLTFTIQTQATANVFTLKNPDRLVLDLDNTKASQTLPAEIHSNGLIQNIRLGHGPDGPKNLRLVMDLAASAQFVYLIDQNSKKSIETITLILTRDKTASSSSASSTQKPLYAEALDLEDLNRQNPILAEKQAPKQQQDLMEAFSNYTRVKQAKMNKVIVMIDPGHGGKDSGAIGPHRHMEKTVVLAISQKLQQILNATPGINARLTRKGDYFISLRQRLNIARGSRAKLFVAIHADSFNATASGASVFALSTKGATSEAARWLAERENTSELSGIAIKEKDKVLKSVLLDMAQTATIEDSLLLGNKVLSTLHTLTNLHADNVEQAAFVVLKSPDIPSVLIETGFISNPQEEARLISPNYQDLLAKAIAQGITDYFAQNPPPDSLFEANYKHSRQT